MIDLHKAVPIAYTTDKRALRYYMRQHLLLVGETGAGKSVTMKALMAYIVAARQPMIGLDFANGATLGPWEMLFSAPTVRTADEAIARLEGLLRVLEYREGELARLELDVWPGDDLFAWVDELGTLVRQRPDAIDLVTTIVSRARKTGVWIALATQNPTMKEMGATELRANMQATIALRLDEHMSQVLWKTKFKQGWDTQDHDDGVILLNDRWHKTPDAAKVVMLPPDGLSNLRAAYPNPPSLDAGTAHALRVAGPEQPDVIFAEAEVVDEEIIRAPLAIGPGRWVPPKLRRTTAKAKATDEQVLRWLHDGWSLVAMKRELGGHPKGENAVNASLRRLERDGYVKRHGYADWRAA